MSSHDTYIESVNPCTVPVHTGGRLQAYQPRGEQIYPPLTTAATLCQGGRVVWRCQRNWDAGRSQDSYKIINKDSRDDAM